jgi:hypothetical protein
VRQIQLASIGEERPSDDFLEPVDLLADGRLGASNPAPGRGQPAGIDDRDEGAEQRDVKILIHGTPPQTSDRHARR